MAAAASSGRQARSPSYEGHVEELLKNKNVWKEYVKLLPEYE